MSPSQKLKWITGLNVKHKTTKPGDNIGENLEDLECGNDFLGTTRKVYSMEETIDEMDLIKIKNCFSARPVWFSWLSVNA